MSTLILEHLFVPDNFGIKRWGATVAWGAGDFAGDNFRGRGKFAAVSALGKIFQIIQILVAATGFLIYLQMIQADQIDFYLIANRVSADEQIFNVMGNSPTRP